MNYKTQHTSYSAKEIQLEVLAKRVILDALNLAMTPDEIRTVAGIILKDADRVESTANIVKY